MFVTLCYISKDVFYVVLLVIVFSVFFYISFQVEDNYHVRSL